MEKDNQPQPQPGALQDKFRLHEEPVSAQAWTGVQKRMAKKKRRLFFLWWITGLSVLGSGAFFLNRYAGPEKEMPPVVSEAGRPASSPMAPAGKLPDPGSPSLPKPRDGGVVASASQAGSDREAVQRPGSESIGKTVGSSPERGQAAQPASERQPLKKAEPNSVRNSALVRESRKARPTSSGTLPRTAAEGTEVQHEQSANEDRQGTQPPANDAARTAVAGIGRESARNREERHATRETGQASETAAPVRPFVPKTEAVPPAPSGPEAEQEPMGTPPSPRMLSVDFMSIRSAGLPGADSLAQNPDPDSVEVLFSKAVLKEEPRRPEKAKLEMALFLGSLVQDVTIDGNGIPTYTTENQNIQARMPASSLGTPLGAVLQLGYRIPLVPGLTMGLGLRSTWIRQKARYRVSPGVNAGTRLHYTGDSLEFRAQALVPDATRTSVMVDAMQELVVDAEWSPRFLPLCFRVMWAPVRFRSRLGSGVPAASNLTWFDWAGLPDMRVSIPFGAGHRIGVQAQFRNVAEGVLPLPVRNSGRQVFIGLGYSKEW